MPASEQALRNREYWDGQADGYQAAHGPQLNVDDLIWGAWSIAEAELGALGEVEGKDILELGCGAARWSIELARRGAAPGRSGSTIRPGSSSTRGHRWPRRGWTSR